MEKNERPCKDCNFYNLKGEFCRKFLLGISKDSHEECGKFRLHFDEWIIQPIHGWLTMSDMIDCELAESGADREMDFDSEEEYYKRYEEYLNFNGIEVITIFGQIIISRPLPNFTKEELNDQKLQFLQSQSRNFFRKLKEQRNLFVMIGKIK